MIRSPLEPEPEVEASAPEPEEARLDGYLDKLPPELRAAVHLYYYEGYSIKEIANLLRLPVPTVGTRLSRGRERLRQLLKEDVE